MDISHAYTSIGNNIKVYLGIILWLSSLSHPRVWIVGGDIILLYRLSSTFRQASNDSRAHTNTHQYI